VRLGISRATLVVALGLVSLVAAPPALASRARILLSTPRPWQVVQRGVDGRADIVVSGRLTGVDGDVRVAWDGRQATAVCDGSGRFCAVVRSAPTGQDTLRVWSTRDPDVVRTCAHVGVGDIYVVAGQSNASGRSPHLFTYSGPPCASMFGNDYRWQKLRDPVDSPVGQRDAVSRDGDAGGSVWPEVATLLVADEGAPVAFVPCARSNTRVSVWQPSGLGRRRSQTLYGSMARRVAAVGGKVRAVLWWQGERDARFLTPPREYEAQLKVLAAGVWHDFRAPLVVAQLGDYDGHYTQAGIDGVRLAQADAWGASHILQGPVLYDIDLGGEVHFIDEDDVAAAAARWAAAILRSVFHADAGSPPRLLSAVWRDDEVVLVTDTELAPRANAGGFLVRSRGVTLPISLASTQGRTVHLVLAEQPQNPLQVSFGEGRSGAGAAVPTDASSWCLPMLPFVDHPVVVAP
jgi:hypothetical protein